ncbi:MAG: DNA internalization-related competence protein ComEC/Rec2 [Nitrospirae bacterium]|nr:DNA internalization-related competence protein ComEC/Rec2 [Nitrospirota bacterium]
MLWLAGFIAGITAGLSSGYFPYTTSILILSIVVSVFLFNHRLRPSIGRSLIFSLLFLAAAVFGFSIAKISLSQATDPASLAGSEVVIETTAFSSTQNSYSVYPYRAYDVNGTEIKGLRQVRVAGMPELELCSSYRMRVKIANDIFLNPGNSAQQVQARLLGINLLKSGSEIFAASLKCVFSRMKQDLNIRMQEIFSPDTAAFLMSVTTGYRGGFSPDLRDAFSSTGLAHLISISGTHFGLLFFVVFQLFKRILSLLPYKMLALITLYATPSQISALMSMPVMVFYLGLSDMSFPAVRSFIMISFFLFGLLLQRRGLWLNTVLLAAALILLFRPDSLLDLSFQLSFTAVLCIGLAADAIRRRHEAQRNSPASSEQKAWPARIKESSKKFIFSTSIISLAASAGTAPLVAYYFHYTSIISPLANLIITPIAGFIVLPLALFSSFTFLISGAFPLVQVIESITSFCIWLIRVMAGFSFAELKISAYPMALLLIFYASFAGLLFMYAAGLRCQRELKLRNYAILTAVGLLPFIIWSASGSFSENGVKVTFLDAGQADSAVIELPDNRVIVIDTARNGFQAASYLHYRGISRIDALVISHAEADHAGGAGYLASRFEISEIWDNGMIEYSGSLADINKRSMLRGDFAEAGRYRITALHPHDSFYTFASDESGENNDSLVLLLDTGKNRFMFSGDIAQEAVDDLVELQDALSSDVIKVPHHGSRTAADEIFYFYVSPRIAVISAGRNNQYGHPHEETIAQLQSALVYRTDVDGAIQVKEYSGGRLEVRSWREHILNPADGISSELANIKRLFAVW